MRRSVGLIVIAAALIVGAVVYMAGKRPASEQGSVGQSPQAPVDVSVPPGDAPAMPDAGSNAPDFEPEKKTGYVHPSLERFGVPVEAELPASANIRFQQGQAGGPGSSTPATVTPDGASHPGAAPAAAGSGPGDVPSPFIIEDPGPAPESGEPVFSGPAPEDSDPGISYPPPEAGDPGIDYPAPEDSDPGIEYPAPEDSTPDPASSGAN